MKVSVDYKKRFEDTYICYYSRMSRFAKSYLIYEEDAENIVQDIFIEIWEKKIDLTAISNVRGYLFLILKNKCIDYIRRKKTETKAISEIQKENEISLKLKFDSLEALDDMLLTDSNIDALIEQLINAQDRDSLITATRALDRVLLWGHYVIPHWHLNEYRIARHKQIKIPEVRPDYGLPIDTWWVE